MATGVRVCRMWWIVPGLRLEAGRDGGCRGVSLLARDLQLLIWEKQLKVGTCVPFIPAEFIFSFFNPFLLSVYLHSVAVPHFFTSSHEDLALFFEDSQCTPQSVQKSTIFLKPTFQAVMERMHLIWISLLTCFILACNTFKQAAENYSGHQCSIFRPVTCTLSVIDLNAWLLPNNLKLDTN